MFKVTSSGVIATIFSFFISAPATAGDTGVASMLHTLRAEKAMVCMVGHYHHGKNPRALNSLDKAYKAAIHHWVTFTTAEYGTDWGSYGGAANHSAKCEKASKSTWNCKVKARPCRRGLSLAALISLDQNNASRVPRH